ncbi:MAG: alkaline phosphatase family protein [Chitinophagales bacterium]|nr:alkaline phosphatase family protein [Chitinophagales bacterium]MDW8418328.1 alkaline phosphatase family protein [Chitinophagales bacterium]
MRCLALLICSYTLFANAQSVASRPQLVVGLVVDQMRWDFLYRYAEKYTGGGFKRLLNEGYHCAYTQINYSPTYTGCGHASIYSGTVPAVHGIVGNNWYDYTEGKYVYCTADTKCNTVGSASKAGQMSPGRMQVSTITDELRLATNFRSKCIGIALKDRGSILPAGHSANAAYFYDPAEGKWVTSTYYNLSSLPEWVTQFNEQKLPEKYLQQNWNTLLPILQYWESDEDDVPYENPLPGEERPCFQHTTSRLSPAYKILLTTPYGNSFTLRFAESAILHEALGKDAYTDFLAISLSSTDYIGHNFGPNSVEIEDCYLRLDRELEQFFAFLDKHVGKGHYLLFITADHGVAHIPDYLKKKKMHGGVYESDALVKLLNDSLRMATGHDSLVLAYENMHIYFNKKRLQHFRLNESEIKQSIRRWLMQLPGVANVYDLQALCNENIPSTIKEKIVNSIYPLRSGDMYVLVKPNWFEDMPRGTTHGTVYPYDTHIPLIWYGWGVKRGTDFSEVHITDIAPTLAAMLKIQEPNGCIGKPITGLLHNLKSKK